MKIILWLLTFCSICFGSIQWNVEGLTNKGTLITSIRQTLPDGWHTYWKNPGDSGAKASIKTTNQNVEFGELEFPKPTLLTLDPLITFGYKNDVTYKLPVNIIDQTDSVSATFHWLECAEVCIPKSQKITLLLPTSTPPIIQQTIPSKNSVNILHMGNKLTMLISGVVSKATFFPYENNYINFNKVMLKNNRLTLPLLNKAPSQIKGELYINNESSPIIIDQTPQNISKSTQSLFFIIIGAFIGGLLLNIMPCVLPIIGIKALQIKKTPSMNRWLDARNYFLGIFTCLMGLYVGLLIFKQGGTLVGWGFQLQSPIVIQSLIILFFTFLLINLDLISVQPSKLLIKSTASNMFWSGVLTTIIATPCTAPFLGAALSVALFQSTFIGMIIFSMIAIGLSLPMILIIVFKPSQRYIPSSGKWTQQFKYILSFGFVITITWLGWVLHEQISLNHQLIFYETIFVIIAIVIIRQIKQMQFKIQSLIPFIITLLGLSIIIFYQPSISSEWMPYSFNRIQSLEEKEHAYFIDVTAKWCVTCQSNKILVLNKNKTKKLFRSKEIHLIQADWTNHDESITNLLNRFNQVSIPTYIYFDGKKHHILSNIISKKDIEELIK